MQLAELAERRLAAYTGVPVVLKHEDFATCGRYLYRLGTEGEN